MVHHPSVELPHHRHRVDKLPATPISVAPISVAAVSVAATDTSIDTLVRHGDVVLEVV